MSPVECMGVNALDGEKRDLSHRWHDIKFEITLHGTSSGGRAEIGIYHIDIRLRRLTFFESLAPVRQSDFEEYAVHARDITIEVDEGQSEEILESGLRVRGYRSQPN